MWGSSGQYRVNQVDGREKREYSYNLVQPRLKPAVEHITRIIPEPSQPTFPAPYSRLWAPDLISRVFTTSPHGIVCPGPHPILEALKMYFTGIQEIAPS